VRKKKDTPILLSKGNIKDLSLETNEDKHISRRSIYIHGNYLSKGGGRFVWKEWLDRELF
jgi:hypothetical protein